jgi:hypothetical protein
LAVFSEATTRMRRFLYRLPRFRTEIPMDLILNDAVVLGTCLNISESGLRGTFSHPLPPGAEGMLTLYNGNENFQIRARIDSFKDEEARVRFRFESDAERDNIRVFLKRLAATPTDR